MFQSKDGRKIPVIFPNQLVHSQVASRLNELVPESEIVSAGEINLTVHKCYGNSTTLKVGVKKGDAKLIHEYDYFHGFPNETGVRIP